jgi:large subunit ribosomal protein L3
MPRINRPRYGSMRFWPRKRSTSILPSVNWEAIKVQEKGLKGFIGYKVGMISVLVKDDTPDSMTKGKKITLPATIIECPELKIFSVRLYKDGKVAEDIAVSNDKQLKRILKVPKNVKKVEDSKKDFDDVRVIVYSDNKGLFKKTPDMAEIGLEGTKEEKISFVKEKIGKGIKASEVFSENLLDVRGVTRGKGLQGPVKRFGISLKSHKSEKGVRRPGSLGPWHPARVSFRVPLAGQTGFHTRTCYNSLILGKRNGEQEKQTFPKYGNLKGDYFILAGSVQGPSKRQVLLTKPLRAPKNKLKKKLELLEIR